MKQLLTQRSSKNNLQVLTAQRCCLADKMTDKLMSTIFGTDIVCALSVAF